MSRFIDFNSVGARYMSRYSVIKERRKRKRDFILDKRQRRKNFIVERNQEWVRMHLERIDYPTIARMYFVSKQYVHQVVKKALQGTGLRRIRKLREKK